MKKYFLSLIIIICLFSQYANAQITFQKAYGGAGDEVAYCINKTFSGGYVIGGYTTSSGNGGEDALIMKIDQHGNVLWSHTFGGTLDDEIRDIHQTSDSGYIACGITNNSGGIGGDMFISKLDKTGTLQWMKTLGLANNDGAQGVVETANHDYVLSGYIQNGSYEIAVARFDVNGNLLWQKGYQGPSTTVGAKIIQLPTGNIFMTGYAYMAGAGMHDMCLLKMDASGNFLWSKLYGTTFDEGGQDIHALPSGKLVIAGESHYGLGNDNIVMIVLDTAGNVILSKLYGNAGKSVRTFSTNQTADGGFISQILDYTVALSDMGLLKTDASGNVQWCYYYGGANDDRSNYVLQTPDHGYILAGYTQSYGMGGKDIYIIKTDSNGYTGPGCQTSYAMGSAAYPAIVTPFAPSLMSAGTLSNIPGAASPVTFTILPVCINPPTAHFVASDTIICEGSCINFSDSSTNNPTIWHWSFPGASTDTSNAQNPSAICYNTQGTYNVRLIVSNYSGSDTLVKTGYIKVEAPPIANITGNTTICAGQSDTLTASGGETYHWSNGLTTATIIDSPASLTTYIVTVTNGVCPPAVDSITVTVSPLPVINAGPDDTICVGDTAFIHATGTGTFAWTPTSGISCTTCPIPQATPLVTTTYTVTLTQGSCSASDALVITVLPAIQANAGTNVAICKGDSTQLHATGGTAYSWSPGSITGPNPVVSPSSTTTYTVTVSNGICTPATDKVTVTVNPIPVANISGDTAICPGSSTVLTASGGALYHWSNNATTAAITVNPSSQTTYSVTVTNLNCTDIATVTVHTFVPQVVDAGKDTTILIGESVQLNATGCLSWSWNPTSGLSCTNCFDPVASPLTTTTYTVLALDNNGCESSDDVTVTIDVNCGAVYIPTVFSPNGDNKNDGLYVRGNCIKDMDFIIYDRWGEKVFTSSSPQDGWDGTFRGKQLESGVFVFNLKATLFNGTTVKRKGSITLLR